MLKEKLTQLRQEIFSFSKKERLFLLCAMFCSFLISADYAIIRPVSNSLFIHAYGAKLFPYAWLFSIPFNLGIVSLYNYYLPRLGCFRTFLGITATIIAGNVASALCMSNFMALPFVFYVWKDIYVMLMFQQLWSVIHSTVKLNKARYLYGVLFGIGAIGGLTGSLIPSFFAVKIGSEALLFSTLPIYLLLIAAYFFLIRNSGSIDERVETEISSTESSFKQGIQLIVKSKLLFAILLMVVFMQVTATVTDFQFNSMLEKLIGDKDLRTEYFGKLLCLGNILTMSFQFIGIFVLTHYLGLQRTHFLVPFILCLNALCFAIFPAFGVISYAFITIKCFDFSLFNVIKEMLYIPLKTEEKFRAKALIDVFMYRGAKVFASFFILFLQFFFASSVVPFLSWVNIGLFIAWCYIVYSIRENYTASQKTPEPLT